MSLNANLVNMQRSCRMLSKLNAQARRNQFREAEPSLDYLAFPYDWTHAVNCQPSLGDELPMSRGARVPISRSGECELAFRLETCL